MRWVQWPPFEYRLFGVELAVERGMGKELVCLWDPAYVFHWRCCRSRNREAKPNCRLIQTCRWQLGSWALLCVIYQAWLKVGLWGFIANHFQITSFGWPRYKRNHCFHILWKKGISEPSVFLVFLKLAFKRCALLIVFSVLWQCFNFLSVSLSYWVVRRICRSEASCLVWCFELVFRFRCSLIGRPRFRLTLNLWLSCRSCQSIQSVCFFSLE